MGTTIGCIGLGVMGEPICANLLARSGCRVLGSIRAPSRWRGCRSRAWRHGPRSRMPRAKPPPCCSPCPAATSWPRSAPGFWRRWRRARSWWISRPRRRSHRRARRELRRTWCGLCRRAGRPNPSRRRARRACGHGRRRAGDLRAYPAAAALFRQRRAALRRDRHRPGRQADEQHGVVRDRRCDRRSAGDRRAQRHRAGGPGRSAFLCRRNHATKALLPQTYPERAFSVRYALKDLEYALDLATQAGIDAPGAHLARTRFLDAIDAGASDRYWPVIAERVSEGG